MCPSSKKDCDPKKKARAAELRTQLKGAGYEERANKVHDLAERGNELSLSMQQNLAATQNLMFGSGSRSSSSPSHPISSPEQQKKHRKTPWEHDSDSESDDGRSDTVRLTLDGTEVIEKEYKLINGHFALITSRKQLHEVDPYLLAQLRQKRERELAKRKAKEEKKKGKGKGKQSGMPEISMALDLLTTMSSDLQRRRGGEEKSREFVSSKDGVREDRGKASASQSSQKRADYAKYEQEISRWRQVSVDKSQIQEAKSPASSLPSSPSASSAASPMSFRVRAEQCGFSPHGPQDNGGAAQNQDELDIWQKIADEDEKSC
ncbi:hypothetical protein F4678DRAFT_433186 [Xylaria arbuscula]|nr:hypothetical protein F4678DRAFT_433186 [Xylaria arbuscula]